MKLFNTREKLYLNDIIKHGKDLVIGLDVTYNYGLYKKNKTRSGEVISGDEYYIKIGKLDIPTDDVYTFIPSDIHIKEKIKKIIKFLLPFIKVDYLNFGNNNNTISYLTLPKLKTVIDKKLDPWDNNYRQEMKIGRFIKNLVGDKMSILKIEKFVNYYKAYVDIILNNSNMELVEGEEIRYWYLGNNYTNLDKGTLSKSCMKYKKNQPIFDIYVKNPQVCKLLIKKDKDDKLLARALVWKTNKGTFLDRVYYVNDNDQNLFYLYAKKKDWKYFNTINYLTVQLKWCKGKKAKKFPYMDTFRYLDIKEKTLSSDDDNHYDLKLGHY